MRRLVITLVTISSVLFIHPAKVYPESPINDSVSSYSYYHYSLRINILGRWYIITYSSDGYIINIVEDDE